MNNTTQTQGLKVERIQFHFLELVGWILIQDWNLETRQDEPTGIWTAFEMADHLEACELVMELGVLADIHSATPDLDVRGNVVFVTCGSMKDGLFIEDFDFAKAVDREIGTLQRQTSLLGW